MTEYDSLADVYEIWSTGDPAYLPSRDFYVEVCRCAKDGVKIVELGIGTGRIAINVAKEGRAVIGVDVSTTMLEHCRINAKQAGVDERIDLIQADIRNFELHYQTELIIFPFRSFGHLLTHNDKRAALQQIYKNLQPGGRFIFDHYIFNEKWARANHGVPHLMYGEQTSHNGGLFIWDTYMYDYSTQIMQCFITVEKTNPKGEVMQRTHHPLSFSWIFPEQVEELVKETGFEVKNLYGDFHFGAFDKNSYEQIWVLQRPE